MQSYDPEKITFFAKTDARGQHVPFGIKAKDRTRHMYVIGKTGMGKSTMLENMAIQDIQNGEGVAFIDPHGSTADKLLDYVPQERMKDVLYFAPFDMEHPVSFNVMEDVGPDKRHLVVSGLMSTFKKIWVDAWSARMEYILSNTMLALLEYPDATLLGVNRMLSDKNYREAVVANISDPSVKSFWVDEFAKYNERYMQEAGDAIKNKIGQFTANPLIRNIIGQPKSSFNVRDIMDGQKILIMNLSKGLVGESNANLLGSMLITRIYLAAMSRADLSAAQMESMPNFYFYVDEFQSFANETFANILSEARKYKLNLTIAHQYIEQMEEEVRDAVFGNVGTTIAFRVGPLDAEFLETVFTPKFLATDLINLGFAQIYLSLMIDGIGSRPFSAVTLPPIEKAEVSYHDQIIAASRKQFAHPRIDVEAEINKWHEPVAPLPKGGRAGGQGGGGQSSGYGGGQSSSRGSGPGTGKHDGKSGGRNDGGGGRRSDGRNDSGNGGNGNAHNNSGHGNNNGNGAHVNLANHANHANANRGSANHTHDGGRKQEDVSKPVQHKDMSELRDVLRNISGGAKEKQIEKENEKEKVVEHNNGNQKRKEQGKEGKGGESQVGHGDSRGTKRTEHQEHRKDHEQGNGKREAGNDRRSGERRDEGRGERRHETRREEGVKKDDASRQGEDLRAALANVVRQAGNGGGGGNGTQHKQSAPPATKLTSSASKLNPADELTRKQLERMLRVNGQERPPLR